MKESRRKLLDEMEKLNISAIFGLYEGGDDEGGITQLEGVELDAHALQSIHVGNFDAMVNSARAKRRITIEYSSPIFEHFRGLIHQEYGSFAFPGWVAGAITVIAPNIRYSEGYVCVDNVVQDAYIVSGKNPSILSSGSYFNPN